MESKKQPKLTAMMIASALDSETAHTSFGKLPLAHEKSAPVFSFGTGGRAQLQKLYLSNELNTGAGKGAPGPKYTVQDNLKFKSPSSFSIGKDPRNTLGSHASYDYFNIVDTFTDPIKSKTAVMKQYGNTKFGTQSRMPPPDFEGTPGPQYNPAPKPEIPRAPEYTLGARRSTGGSAIKNQISTPALVGPGRYVPETVTAAHTRSSKWTFGRGDKIGKDAKSVSRNQTYDTKSVACGSQVSSTKKSQNPMRFKTATRDQVSKLGMFRDMMSTQPTPVKIPMPKF